MIRYISCCMLLFRITAGLAQTLPDTGPVKYDSAFNCIENSSMESSQFKIPGICDSKNELEIRLKTYGAPKLYQSLIILSFNQGKWGIEKYLLTNGTAGNKISHTFYPNPYDNNNNIFFLRVFDLLKENHVFTLPNQRELKLNGSTNDGAFYLLSFKINNRFGSYSFTNPRSYLEQNPGVIELKNYYSIVDLMRSMIE